MLNLLVKIGGSQTFCKEPDNIFDFACQPASVITAQLQHCSMKAAIDSISKTVCGCVPINLYLQRNGGRLDLVGWL